MNQNQLPSLLMQQEISSQAYFNAWGPKSCCYGTYLWLLVSSIVLRVSLSTFFSSPQEHQSYQTSLSLTPGLHGPCFLRRCRKVHLGTSGTRYSRMERTSWYHAFEKAVSYFTCMGSYNLENSRNDLPGKSLFSLPELRKASRPHLRQLIAPDGME